jgi:hypothetical protein
MKKSKLLAIVQAVVMLFAITMASGCFIEAPGWHGGGHWHSWDHR